MFENSFSDYEKRGYLLEEFRLFHLSGAVGKDVTYHYHDFHKLLLLVSGEADYIMEGRRYRLAPGDLALVTRGCVHRPDVPPGGVYDRIILYISPDFLRANSYEGCDLEGCFTQAASGGRPVLRGSSARIFALAAELEDALKAGGFGQALLCRSLMLRLLVELGRGVPGRRLSFVDAEASDSKSADILRYISAHLTEELSIDALAEKFYISKYHMMRSFKADTGRTVHGYISDKRLLLARDLIAAGQSATETCYRCGFKSYSSFSRAYAKLFGVSPRGRSDRPTLSCEPVIRE